MGTTGVHKILGVQWVSVKDMLTFGINGVCHQMDGCEPTKRMVVSMSARFFDPFGVVSPITVNFKIFYQRLREEKKDWDEPLRGTDSALLLIPQGLYGSSNLL